ncbi:MAG: 50S ribosomal protein L19 [Rickettsiaceae bacterium]
MNIIEQFEKEQISQLTKNNIVPKFKAGDTVSVNVKITTGANTRFQKFEGVVIAKKNRSLNSSFIVRKVINGLGVERKFALYSPNITITVVKCGIVRRAKLYYLRQRQGKSARIKEDIKATRQLKS